MPQITLAQLLFAFVCWCICLGAIFNELADWCYAPMMLASAGAILACFARIKNSFQASFVSLPLMCLLNFSSFLVTLGYLMGRPSTAEVVLGPLARVVSFPMVIVQNSLPLAGASDTLIAIPTVSLLEVAATAVIVWQIRRRFANAQKSKD